MRRRAMRFVLMMAVAVAGFGQAPAQAVTTAAGVGLGSGTITPGVANGPHGNRCEFSQLDRNVHR
jgi:hypothetical protein